MIRKILIVTFLLVSTNWFTYQQTRAYEAALLVGERIEMKKQKEARLKVIKKEEHYFAWRDGNFNQEEKEKLAARINP